MSEDIPESDSGEEKFTWMRLLRLLGKILIGFVLVVLIGYGLLVLVITMICGNGGGHF